MKLNGPNQDSSLEVERVGNRAASDWCKGRLTRKNSDLKSPRYNPNKHSRLNCSVV